jgi:hypothetical protein
VTLDAGHPALDFTLFLRDSTHMGRSLRVFLVHEDDSVERIAAARFQRLWGRRDLSERWPEHAGKRLRYAMLYLDTDDDEMKVLHADFSFIEIDAEGRHDEEGYRKTMHDAVNLMSGMGGLYWQNEPSNVIGEQAFRQRRYKIEHRWEPNAATTRALSDALRGGRAPRRARWPRSNPS